VHRMRLLTAAASIALIAAAAAPLAAQQPLTRAERSDYLETSRYADVMAFLDSIADSPRLHRTTFGYSHLGRPLPLIVVGAPDASPEAVLATGRTRVYVQANIHGGEVEGKEALQMLLRDLAAGAHPQWTDSLVLLIAPIYNADGNDAVRITNRSDQHGPLAGVGERANAQGLDLNRDHTKLDSPEARSLVRLMTRYDPHVAIDLHTTNGTHHAYHLTYSPPLHPSTDSSLVAFLRDEWLPTLTGEVRAEHGWETYFYGNLPIREWGMTGERGWYTFDHRPRFNNNYVGLRNRMALLSEAYSYASFRERVAATRAFVDAALDFAAANASRIRRLTARADADSPVGDSLAVRATHRRGPMTEILLGEVEERVNPYSGEAYSARLDVVRPETIPDYGSFRATETERVPRAYYVPDRLGDVLELLRAHGIRLSRVGAQPTGALEAFAIDSTRVAEREFQGHRERELFGEWRATDATPGADAWVVDMTQPLARLAFQLLEPRADDGLVNWNVLDEALVGDDASASPARAYPILRSAD